MRGIPRKTPRPASSAARYGAAAIMRMPGRIRISLGERHYAEDRDRGRHADAPARISLRRRQRRRAELAGHVDRQLADSPAADVAAAAPRTARRIAACRDDQPASGLSAEERCALQRERAADRVHQSHQRAQRRFVAGLYDGRGGPSESHLAVRHQLALQEGRGRFGLEPHTLLGVMTSSTRVARSGQARFSFSVAFVLALAVSSASAQSQADVADRQDAVRRLVRDVPRLRRRRRLGAAAQPAQAGECAGRCRAEGDHQRRHSESRHAARAPHHRERAARARRLRAIARPHRAAGSTVATRRRAASSTPSSIAPPATSSRDRAAPRARADRHRRLRGPQYLRQAIVEPAAALPTGTLRGAGAAATASICPCGS